MKKLFTLVILFLFIISNTVMAHDVYFIQSLINTSDFSYIGIVSLDKCGTLCRESNHAEARLGNFSRNKNLSSFNLTDIKSKDPSRGDGSNMVLSFPGNKSLGDAKAIDHQNAERVQNLLFHSLNTAIRFVSPKGIRNVDELATITDNLLKRNVSGYSIRYGISSSQLKIRLPEGITVNDVVSIRDNSTGDEIQLIYQVTKSEQENFKITWGHIAEQALTAYYHHGYTLSNAHEQVEPNLLTKAIIGVLNWFATTTVSLLGLYTLDELILNEGIRNVTYNYGAYPKSWHGSMTLFYNVFLFLAYLLLIFSMVKLGLEKNLSTISSSARVDLQNRIKNLLIAGMLMPISFIFINNVILKPSFLLTQVFGRMTVGSLDQAYAGFGGGQIATLGAFIVQFAYFFILIYLNIVYIIRAITIAVLVTASPIFIASIALNNDAGLFKRYTAELFGNSLTQVIHAFVISFFSAVSVYGLRTIESLVILFSLIPITKLFKSLIIQAGGGAEEMGGSAYKSALGLATGAVAGFTMSKKVNSRNRNMEGSGGYSSNTIPTIADNRFDVERDYMTMTKHDTKEAIDGRNKDLSISKEEAPPLKVSEGNILTRKLQDIKNLRPSPSTDNKLKQGLSSVKSGAGKIAGGITLMGAGIGSAIATGNPSLASSMLTKSGAVVGSMGGQDIKSGNRLIREHIAEKKKDLSEGFVDGKLKDPKPYQEKDYEAPEYFKNTLGVERLDNGDIIVARDLNKIRENEEGILDVIDNGDGTTGIVYDAMINKDFLEKHDKYNISELAERMSLDDRKELQKIAELYNKKKFEELREYYGIESVSLVRKTKKSKILNDKINKAKETTGGIEELMRDKFHGAINVDLNKGEVDGYFLQINYNKDGLKNLGVTDIKKHRGRIFEHKQSDDSIYTKKVHKSGIDFNEEDNEDKS